MSAPASALALAVALALTLALGACGDSGAGSGVDARAPLDSGWTDDGGTGPVCPTGEASGFHASLQGSPEGDGSPSDPWDLTTALDRPPGVGPGDTIWIHGGRYVGSFVVKQEGLPGAPITLRAWPGERVTLDGESAPDEPVLQIYHEWMVIRDLEITNSHSDRRSERGTGIYVGGDHVVLANLVVHDVGTGVSGGRLRGDDTQEGTDILVYGSIFYNNGWLGPDRGHGHHTYLTNRDSVVRVEDSILFYSYGFGVHNYSYSDSNYVRNNELVGNVWFLNGAPGGKLYDNCMVGHDGTLLVSGVLLRENLGWALDLDHRDVRLGWDTANENATVVDNYLVGQTIFEDQWSDVTMTGNTFIGPVEGVDVAQYPENTYLDAPPTDNHVVVRPNRFEPGRAHLIVYNWEGLAEVSVDLAPAVPIGTEYEVRNAQNVFSAPVASGTYDGSPIALPMTGLDPALPIGDPDAIPADQRTGRDFNVFLLRSAVCDQRGL
jgi:hypothetical protein